MSRQSDTLDGLEIPGFDPTAPHEDQLELLDQLITLKLQNVDAIWADIHHIIVDKILPSVKRYSQNSQPTREAAYFWKSFYETAANIHLPEPGGEASPSNSQHDSPTQREEEYSGEQDGNRTPQASAGGSEDPSYIGEDHTPSNYSFNPAVSSTPAAGERYHSELDVDVTTASNASSFPTFSASLQSQKQSSSTFGGHPQGSVDRAVGVDRKGKGKAVEASNTTTSSFNLSNVPIFSNSPSPARTKSKGKSGPLRDNVLRQMHLQAVSPAKPKAAKPKTPKRMRNPFRQSTVFTPLGDVVDLGRYSPSSSNTTDDSTIQLDLSPKTKLKVFSTPQYKLALRSKEEAVAIQMSEARARASDYTSSEDSYIAPPTPLTARKQAQYQREQKAILQAQYDRDQARATTGLSLSDDDDISEGNGGISDDDSFSDDDFGGNDDTVDDEGDEVPTSSQPMNTFQALAAQPPGSHSFDTDSSFDQSFGQGDVDEYIGEPLSNLSLPSAEPYRSAIAPASAAKSLVSYDSTDDQAGEGDYSHAYASELSTDQGDPERTGPTETIFGVRAADKKITEAEWQRKLSKPVPGRLFPEQALDSPTPAETVNSRWPSGLGGKGRR